MNPAGLPFLRTASVYTAGVRRIHLEAGVRKWWIAATAVLCVFVAHVVLHARSMAPATDVSGKWHFVFDTPGGARDFDAEFTVDADGKVGGSFGKSTAIGTFKDGHLVMDFPAIDEQSGESSQLKMDGKLEDAATLSGSWQFSSYDGSFRAIRPKKDDAPQP
jgi:hypothetical protein